MSKWIEADLTVDEARKEVQDKTTEDINKETAYKWASRAIACYEFADQSPENDEKNEWALRAEDFRHEALEHAALVGDASFAKEIHDLMAKKHTSPEI